MSAGQHVRLLYQANAQSALLVGVLSALTLRRTSARKPLNLLHLEENQLLRMTCQVRVGMLRAQQSTASMLVHTTDDSCYVSF